MTAKLLAKTINPKRMMASEMKRVARSKNKQVFLILWYFFVIVVVKVARPLLRGSDSVLSLWNYVTINKDIRNQLKFKNQKLLWSSPMLFKKESNKGSRGSFSTFQPNTYSLSLSAFFLRSFLSHYYIWVLCSKFHVRFKLEIWNVTCRQ